MTIIAGSRTLTQVSIEEIILNSGFNITRLLHGDARGVDTIAKGWALSNGYPISAYPADWNNLAPENDFGIKPLPVQDKNGRWYDAKAGFRRNEQMALAELQVDCQLIAIIQSGYKSNGTWDMIKRAEKHGLKVYREVI